MGIETGTTIGTVEILIQRVYALDPDTPDPHLEAVVEAGTYPLYDCGGAKFWLMEGTINMGGVQRMGDGMFIAAAGGADVHSDIPVRFPSKRFGPDEWAALLDHTVCREGHPSQRMRVTLT
jgi:hypothetical protein